MRLFRDTADVVENEMLPVASLPPGPSRKSYERYPEFLDRYHVHTHNLCVARAVQCLDDPDTFARGVPATDIAVLVRTRATAGMVVEALAGAGIDARCEGRAGLFQQPEAEVDLALCFRVSDERRATVGRAVELLRKVVPAMEEADLVTTYHRLLNALGVHQ